MRKLLPTFIDTKYNIILSQERRAAKAVARRVVKMPDVTVWSFMIPLFFVFNLLRYKRASEAFALNLLFTKKLALDAVLEIMKKGQSRQDMIAQIEHKTTNILAADKRSIYSDKIRRKQMKEINLLLDHYLKLLQAEGRSYESLVKDAYQTQDNYRAFLQQLTAAEKTVNWEALQTVGRTETARQIISDMEEAAEDRRTEEARKIFS